MEVLRGQKYQNKHILQIYVYMYVYIYVCVCVFSASFIPHTHTLETKHRTTGPIWNARSYAFRKFWRFYLQRYKKLNIDMLQCYNADFTTLI